MTIRTLELDAVIRSVEVNRRSPHALFLGAGASLTSGVPSAWSCVLEWKRRIFETNNPSLKDAVAELSLPSVQQRIDDWLQTNALWPGEDEDDYGFFIEKCLPIEDDRRKYFQGRIKSAQPHIGYQLLGLLAEQRIIRSVWTTNFDGLVAKAALVHSSVTPIEIGLDSQHRIDRQENEDDLPCVALHGDYRYDKLQNTEPELQQQEQGLAKYLIQTLQKQSLIVSGYSGRDRSIMETLHKAIVQQQGEGNVYWCGFGEHPEDSVARLLDDADKAKREAFYVPNVGFDELAVLLTRQCLDEQRARRADKIIGTINAVSVPTKATFAIPKRNVTGLIKSNAFSLTVPSEAFSFELTEWPEKGRWKMIKERSAKNGFVAVPAFGGVLAMGTLDKLQEEFNEDLDGDIERSPIKNADLQIVNGAVHSLITSSLIQAIAAHCSLETDGRSRVWDNNSIDRVQHGGTYYSIHRCAQIDLRCIGSSLHITIDPTFYVPAIGNDDSEGHHEARKTKLGYQHNDKFAADLDYWRTVLLAGGEDATIEFDFPKNTAAFKFKINLMPSFAKIGDGRSRTVSISEKHQPLVKHCGHVFEEPSLLFATVAGWNPTTDTFPLRGLSANGPFDIEWVRSLPQPDIQLAVICPKAESKKLAQFLHSHNRKLSPPRSGEYVVDFKGFADTYGCKLIVPSESDPHWVTLPELTTGQDTLVGCKALTQNICQSLVTTSSLGRSVALILTPHRWQKFRVVETDSHVYNVHDDVKAFAVRNGVATQFLDQDTLDPYDACRVWWWLSLAAYTKAMRTPWVLKTLDTDSAFVGLGYSIDRKSDQKKKIVVGSDGDWLLLDTPRSTIAYSCSLVIVHVQESPRVNRTMTKGRGGFDWDIGYSRSVPLKPKPTTTLAI